MNHLDPHEAGLPFARPPCTWIALAALLLVPAAPVLAQDELPPSAPQGASAEDTEGDEADEGDTDAISERFVFGSYGRATAGSDLRGGTGRQVRVIAHPPRLLESSYAELDFGYVHEVEQTGAKFFTRSTLALGEELFHFDGNFESSVAVRNLYLEVQDAIVPGVSIWAGSRMYRGDDIYLLDFWPLDEQNTVGGGVTYDLDKDTSLRLHVGLNRLDNHFQQQSITVVGEDLETRDVLFVDRQRAVVSVRGEQHFTLTGNTRLKYIPYGEVHSINGAVRRNDDQTEEALPSDFGWLVGLEVGAYGYGTRSYTNLFLRYASGLAAYDELAIPFGLSSSKKATGAAETMLGISSNYETEDVGLLFGGYARYFVDADPDVYDRDDAWEVGAALRPAWFVTQHVHLLAEGNLQYLRPNGISEETAKQEIPMVYQVALMPSLSLDRGSYARPQLRLVYSATFLNDSARFTYAPEDPLRQRSVQHFLGFSVEWWFNSSRG